MADHRIDGTLEIAPPDNDAVDELVEMWVELAADQRDRRSHLLAEENRTRIREALLQHVVTGTARIARVDGDPVGFVAFDVETERYEQDVDRGFVHNIYVREPLRGHGIGTALLDAAEAALADRGVDIVALEVMAENEPARRFYRRHGYGAHRIEMEKHSENDSLTTDDG